MSDNNSPLAAPSVQVWVSGDCCQDRHLNDLLKPKKTMDHHMGALSILRGTFDTHASSDSLPDDSPVPRSYCTGSVMSFRTASSVLMSAFPQAHITSPGAFRACWIGNLWAMRSSRGLGQLHSTRHGPLRSVGTLRCGILFLKANAWQVRDPPSPSRNAGKFGPA